VHWFERLDAVEWEERDLVHCFIRCVKAE